MPQVPPLAGYGVLTGQLFLYGSGRAAFESPVVHQPFSAKKCILMGGLSDGLLPVPYTQALEQSCSDANWSLVQAVISSSYTGFGHGSLQRDCQELEELMRYLINFRNAEEFCIVGHSTGCQDAIYFLEHASLELRERTKIVALQAPVSDREGAMLEEGYTEHLSRAHAMVSGGKGEEMMPRAAFWAPITARRLVDLHAKGGADDYFSSDYTDEELVERLQHVGKHKDLKVLVASSGEDEYVPSHIDKSTLTDRLVTAMNTLCDDRENPVARRFYIPTGNHNLSVQDGDGLVFAKEVGRLLSQL